MLKEKFFGRSQYLNILEKRIRDLKDGYRQNLAFIGDELIGKTSVIFKLLDSFDDNRILLIYLDIRQESVASFAKRFIGTMLYNFLSNSGFPLKEDLDFLIKKSERYIPKTSEEIKCILACLKKRKRNDIFVKLLSLCEVFHQETSKSCVVIFDEFQNLENIGINSLYKEWSKILISQKNTMYIIVSSLKFKAKEILTKELSLLFGNFEVVPVEPFDIKTSEEFLENRFGVSGAALERGLRDFIVHFTGGFPFYLEIMSQSVIKSQESSLADILEGMLFDPSGILHQKFSNYLKRFLDSSYRQDYIAILQLVSSGHNKLKDIAHVLRRPKKEVILRINNLQEIDALTRSGDFLSINDRVFSFWLKFVYKERLRSFTFDAANQKESFRMNIEGAIQEFIRQAQRTVPERISELLGLFSDETIQLETKKLRLTHFREIKPLEFNRRNLKDGLIGRSHDALWIIAFKKDSLNEEDISEFAKECKKYRHKLQRKIMVTLQDIDMNARLRALEEKILTWDINSLNYLLDMFSKPRIIA